MQVFEFHFNPKLRPDLIFNSFCYEPENIYERRLGSLYMVGLLKNVLPKNLQFLEKLAKLIKERYYKGTIFTPEKSLKESLREANEFLEELAKKGDVSWLGNLSFAVLSLKDFKLNFTKVGEIKFFLLRGKKLIDIDRKLRLQDIEPYPLKIFGNIIWGKLAENDIILVLTKEIFDFFQEENLIDEVAKLAPHQDFDEGLREILEQKREALMRVSGICLAIILTKEKILAKKETILPQISKEFSLREVFAPLLKVSLRITNLLRIYELRINLLKFLSKKINLLKNSLKTFREKLKSLTLNKKLILVLTLIFVLLLGFIFSQFEKSQRIKIYQKNLKEIQENLNLTEGYLILRNPQATKKANSLLKESWEKISPILTESRGLPKDFNQQIFSLKDEILEKLYNLNKLEKIDNPELFYEFKTEEFIPQKLIVFDEELYFFSPYSKNLFLLKENKETEIIEIGQKISLANRFNDEILFFSKPNQLTVLSGGGQSSVSFKEPYPDFNFDDFSSFKGNLYFFDKKAGQIIRYLYLGNFQWGEAELWLRKSVMGKSIAVDGSVWILGKDNSVGKYYAGVLQEKIELDIFPYSKDISKIFTSPYLPYLYILEPAQKRIIVITKTGEIMKQFQSEKFDNLLDFAVSEDGKTIWLLNGLKVYQIKF